MALRTWIFFVCLCSSPGSCDAKEKEILLERQSLSERHKTLQQGQERLLDGQALQNQREDYIFNRSEELSQIEKKLDAAKLDIENEHKALRVEKTTLELKEASLLAREEVYIPISSYSACWFDILLDYQFVCFLSKSYDVCFLLVAWQAVIKRECELNKKEEDLLILQEKLATKESVSHWFCLCCQCSLC